MRLLEHTNNNKILVKEQFGSRSKWTVETASYSLISEILNPLNNKNIIGGIFCDLTKAFDCLIHGIMLSKLKYYGLTGTCYSLINSYLEDRHQKVKLVNNDYKSCSSLGTVKHGVLQRFSTWNIVVLALY
jgi:hypothetical protein